MEPGEIVGQKYRIARKIGEGGMGVVYEAEHTVTGRRCAVKVLERRGALPKEDVDRFLREAQASAKISHMNIVDVTDAGSEADGTPYIVMELLEGETLDQVIKRDGVVQPGPLATMMSQLLDGLDAMHARGYVHRDLKPANIFLVAESSMGVRVKVLDFGIAKALAEESRTQSGYVIGTPAYMAPEQMRNARNATPRCDLWSVGIILYEALVGHRPFRGETFGLLAMISGPGKHVSLATVAPHIPRALSDFVDTLLSKDPAQRPASAAAVKARLIPLLATCPSVHAVDPPPDPNATPRPGTVPVEDAEHDPTEERAMDSGSTPMATDAILLARRHASATGSRLPLIAAIVVAVIAAAGVGAYLHAKDTEAARRRHERARETSGERPVTGNAALSDFLHNWLGTVTGSQGQASVTGFYAEATKFRGSPGLSTPGAIQRYWGQLFVGGGSFVIDWDRSTFAEEPANLNTGASAACINLSGASGPVLRVRAWATEQMRDRAPSVGCDRLEGVYLLRLRRASGALRICHETWSLREGICASCPTAAGCQDGGTGR